jgi:hypothetical protein
MSLYFTVSFLLKLLHYFAHVSASGKSFNNMHIYEVRKCITIPIFPPVSLQIGEVKLSL